MLFTLASSVHRYDTKTAQVVLSIHLSNTYLDRLFRPHYLG